MLVGDVDGQTRGPGPAIGYEDLGNVSNVYTPASLSRPSIREARWLRPAPYVPRVGMSLATNSSS